jgi:hypothetical protein
MSSGSKRRSGARRVLGSVSLIDLVCVVNATGIAIEEQNEVQIWHFDDNRKLARFCHQLDSYHHSPAHEGMTCGRPPARRSCRFRPRAFLTSDERGPAPPKRRGEALDLCDGRIVGEPAGRIGERAWRRDAELDDDMRARASELVIRFRHGAAAELVRGDVDRGPVGSARSQAAAHGQHPTSDLPRR